MLPSIVVYLPPRDILTCIQTSKKWKEEIDTDYVWNNRFLPSMIVHLPPRDIAQCIAASTKWHEKIQTVEAFWQQVVNVTVPTPMVDAMEEYANTLLCGSGGGTTTLHYESIAMACSLEQTRIVPHIGERVGTSVIATRGRDQVYSPTDRRCAVRTRRRGVCTPFVPGASAENKTTTPKRRTGSTNKWDGERTKRRERAIPYLCPTDLM